MYWQIGLAFLAIAFFGAWLFGSIARQFSQPSDELDEAILEVVEHGDYRPDWESRINA